MMGVVAFIRNGRCYKQDPQGVFRDSDGKVYDSGDSGERAPQARVRKYENICRQMPQWIPKHPGEKPPYPHVVETRPGSGRYWPAFNTKAEIREFEAKSGGKWSYGRGD